MATSSVKHGVGVGSNVRAARRSQGVSAKSLAELLGISASAVSQIERGVMQPSVARLIAIADALSVPLAALLDEETSAPVGKLSAVGDAGTVVTRKDEVAPVELEGGVVFRRLSPSRVGGVDFFQSMYPPGATASLDADLFTHQGYEIGTVVEGELTIEFADESIVLRAGDSASYPCERSHRIINHSDAMVVANWLILHP